MAKRKDGKTMAIKKEVLSKLTEEQLKKLAEHKGIKFALSETKQKYYQGWNEKDKIVDIMSGHQKLTVTDIELFLKKRQ